ncbi:MAG: MBL fold metallo-hydrolase [Acidobacteria bacterium]|nr:MBL fold metallo-hydrolase [Acidobacteriota bacterium]
MLNILHQRRRHLAALVGILLIPFTAYSRSPAEPEPFPVVRLADHLYKIEADGNSVIASVGPDGFLLCDVVKERLTPRLRANIRELGGTTVRLIINTHWHTDHTGGNLLFGKEALIIAHENVRQRLSEDKYLKFWDESHPAYPPHALPDVVFRERMTVHFNGETIDLIYLPPGHTDGDVVVHFREANVLHVGDCMFSNGFPAIDFETGGSVAGFADALDRIAELMPPDVRIVTGHGPDVTMAELREYARMVRASLRSVCEAMARGLDAAAMQRSGLLSEWAAYGHGYFSREDWIDLIYQSLLHENPKTGPGG